MARYLLVFLTAVTLGLAFSSPVVADEGDSPFPDAYQSASDRKKEIDDVSAAIKAKGAKWVAGETAMNRFTHEERKRRLGVLKHGPEAATLTASAPQSYTSGALTATLPATLDWRSRGGNYVTGIRNQGNCGSCWAFGSIAGLESKTLIMNRTPGVDLNLSEQVMVSCSGAGDCNGGYILRSYFVNTGAPLETCYPYTATNGNCANACANWQQSTYKVPAWGGVYQTLSDMKNALYTYGPFVTAFEVYHDFDSYTSGIYTHVSGKYEGSHAVLLVGYDDANSCFIVKNSWGSGWGEGGYFRIAYTELTSVVNFGEDNVTYGNPIVYVTSSITAPATGSTISRARFKVTGSAAGSTYSVQTVEVSTNGGSSWSTATDTSGNGSWSTWSYDWTPASYDSVNVLSRATDTGGNVEFVGSGVTVTVARYNNAELQHYNWDASFTGGSDCTFCHVSANKFLSSGFRKDAGFCNSCHNQAGTAHGSVRSGKYDHTIFLNVTTGGNRMPTYGNLTGGEINDKPVSRLKTGNKVMCATCHNPMRKSDDYGRVWELTTTSDRIKYALQKGGWSSFGNLVPLVYRDKTLWGSGGPTYSKTKKGYFVDPSEYTYNEATGFIRFNTLQNSTSYVYVTLDYPFLRASQQDNRLCSDCHTQATHKSGNCLTCHRAHNTGNLEGVRETVRTTDRSERAVKFLRFTGLNSFADGNSTYDGICEVCHTRTKYYRRDGTGFTNHSGNRNYNGKNCVSCHKHSTGFAKY